MTPFECRLAQSDADSPRTLQPLDSAFPVLGEYFECAEIPPLEEEWRSRFGALFRPGRQHTESEEHARANYSPEDDMSWGWQWSGWD